MKPRMVQHTTPQPTPAEAAEAYAALGWHVFPVQPNKRPPAGFKWADQATTDLDTIRDWWTGPYSSYGVAIVTGHKSGIWVLDVDVADGKTGPQTMRAIRDENGGSLPETVTLQTQSGGIHYYYRWSSDRPVTNGAYSNIKAKYGEGVDVRGEGGYVVAPPTRGDTGQYLFTRSPWDIDPADAPDWMYSILLDPIEPTNGIGPVNGVRLNLPTGTAPDSTAIDDYVATVSIRDLLLDSGWVEHHRTGEDIYWTRPGKPRRDGHSAVQHGNETLVVFTTQLPAELARMGGKPTVDGSGVTFNRFDLVAALEHNGDRSAAAKAIRAAHTPLPLSAPTVNVDPVDVAESDDDRLAADFAAQFISGDDIMNLPPPDPLVGTWIDRGAITVMPGPFGSGKTHLTYDLALSVTSGEPWLGQTVHRTGPAWLFIGEGAYTLRDRARGWLTRHPHQIGLPDTLKVYPRSFDLDRPETWPGFRAYLQQLIALEGDMPELIVFDTWSRYTSGAEIPEVTKPAMAAVEAIRDATGAAVLLPTHTGHSQTGRSRGDSTLEDNADIVIPVMAPLRDRQTGKITPVQIGNTKQKARATQQPIWIVLEEQPDPEATDLEPNKTLAWVRPAGDDDLADDDTRREVDALHKVWTYIEKHDCKYTSREIEKHEAPGSALLGSQRFLKDAVGRLVAYGCVDHDGIPEDGGKFSRQPLKAIFSPYEIEADTPK